VVTVVDNVGLDGTDTLRNIERLQFADVNIASPATSTTVAAPDVVGNTQAVAIAALGAAGLTASTTLGNSQTVPGGSIISQNPPAGTPVAFGSSIALVVSSGPVTVAVPSVVDSALAAATASLAALGLAVTTTNATHPTIVAGNVISQLPVAGVNAIVGSSVALLVSSGPAAPAGLVTAFGFNEATGTTAINSSNVAFNGTIRQALRVPGKFGGALSFDGVNDWVTINDATNGPLDLTAGMTLQAWVKPGSLGSWNTVVLKERGAGNLSYGLYAHDGAPQPFGFNAPAGYTRTTPVASTVDTPVRAGSPLAVGVWQHLATTYDGTNMRLYVNGVLVATRAQTGSIATSNGALRIGGNNAFANEFYHGLIDEVRVYNRALSAAEIAGDMNRPIQ
jgi:hypothetical protein